jgi:hypothetical protein
MTDSIETALFSLKRNCPSKGFNIAVFPGAPFGPEVVLSLREGDDVPTPDATIHTEHKGEVDELSFMKLERNGVIVLLDLETVSAICDALRFHEMSERGDREDVPFS